MTDPVVRVPLSPERGPRSTSHWEGFDAGWLGREPPAFQAKFCELLMLKSLPPGQPIYASDDHGDLLIGIAAGHVALTTPLVSGEEVIVHVCSPGFWLGVTMLASQEKRRHLGATTRGDVTLGVLSLPVLMGVLQAEPEWWPSMARLMEVHATLSACIVRDLLLRRHRDRIIATLLRLGGFRPQPRVSACAPRILVTHDELATMANCSRSLVNTELRRLQAAGHIELDYGCMTILTPEAMLASLTQ